MIILVNDTEKLIDIISWSGQGRKMRSLTADAPYEVLMQGRKVIANKLKKQVKLILKKSVTMVNVDASKGDRNNLQVRSTVERLSTRDCYVSDFLCSVFLCCENDEFLLDLINILARLFLVLRNCNKAASKRINAIFEHIQNITFFMSTLESVDIKWF